MNRRRAGLLRRAAGVAAKSRADAGSGFTLLELLVVMVIIGLLAGFVAPRYFAQVGKSQVKVARAQLVAFDKALDQFRLDVGRYPTSEEGLQVRIVDTRQVDGGIEARVAIDVAGPVFY